MFLSLSLNVSFVLHAINLGGGRSHVQKLDLLLRV